MEKIKTVRGIAKAGAILLKIAEVFCAIGVIATLIGIIALAALPADLMQVDLVTDVTVKMHMADWLGRENWEKIRESATEAIAAERDQELTVTDDGMEVRTNDSKTMDRGELALNAAPAILTMAVAWYFCRTLGKFLRDIRNGGEPFRKENAELLRVCGIALLVGSAAPALVYALIDLFADVTGSQGIDMVQAFTGLMFLGLAALFEVADARRERETPAPPFAGYTGYAAPQAPAGDAPKPEEPKPEETPENNAPYDPNAF